MLHTGVRAEQALAFEHTVEFDVIVRQAAHHRMESVFFIHHGHIHIIHIHNVNDILRQAAAGAIRDGLGRQDVAKHLGDLHLFFLRTFFIGIEDGIAQQVIIFLQLGEIRNKVMAKAAGLLLLHRQEQCCYLKKYTISRYRLNYWFILFPQAVCIQKIQIA